MQDVILQRVELEDLGRSGNHGQPVFVFYQGGGQGTYSQPELSGLLYFETHFERRRRAEKGNSLAKIKPNEFCIFQMANLDLRA